MSSFFQKILIIITLIPSLAKASQDDARTLLREPTFLFSGNQADVVKFLPAVAARGNFGAFFETDEHHSWRYGVGLDIALMSFGENSLWRFGVNFDGLADSYNSIGFRIGQYHYEVFTAYELKLDDSVLYIGHRHRCRHGADRTPTRIIMKTGEEIGFNSKFSAGPVDFIWSSSLLAYLYGQNDDLRHQHRLNLSGSIQAEWDFLDNMSLFASSGLSMIWVTASTDREYFLWSPINDWEWGISPGASLGVNLKGEVGDFKFFAAYDSVLDTGFHDQAKHIHTYSINGEFWF